MINYTYWDTYGVCSCGRKEQAPFGDLFHIHLNCCRSCGSDKYELEIKTMRKVIDYSNVVWWRPSTWAAKIYWETKE